VNHWTDPYELLAKEDPNGSEIASIISQDAIPARFSGAAITKKDGNLLVEGKEGSGDSLMLGRALPERLPKSVVDDVIQVDKKLRPRLGRVRFEWVHDGKQVWIVQLHKGGTKSTISMIVPGEAERWEIFQSTQGLDRLRELLNDLPPNVGIELHGEVGLTSHVADLVRKVGRPTRVVPHKEKLLFSFGDE
jgi:hypothetical protein